MTTSLKAAKAYRSELPSVNLGVFLVKAPASNSCYWPITPHARSYRLNPVDLDQQQTKIDERETIGLQDNPMVASSENLCGSELTNERQELEREKEAIC